MGSLFSLSKLLPTPSFMRSTLLPFSIVSTLAIVATIAWSFRRAEARRKSPRRVVCIGDIHGNIEALKSLWAVLEMRYDMATIDVVFLGDYCDRGPATCAVFEWMIALTLERAGGDAKTTFLSGNHDFCMAAFCGCKTNAPAGFDVESTNPGYPSGFWPHPVAGGMLYQGRRWANETTYQSTKAFESYGIDVANGRIDTAAVRPELLRAMPEAHRAFLEGLPWVYEEKVDWQEQEHGGISVFTKGLEPHSMPPRHRPPAYAAAPLIEQCSSLA